MSREDMKKALRLQSFPIAGFELAPQGKLLSQFVDFNHSVGAAYERCVAYFKDFHTHDRINLAFPRGSSLIEFKTKYPNAAFKVDENSFLWMPPDVVHSQNTLSTVYDNMALFPSLDAIESAAKALEKRYRLKCPLPTGTIKKQRSALLNELLDRYFIERILENNGAILLEDLSRQILEETLRILLYPNRNPSILESIETDRKAFGEDPALGKAIQYLEAHLFQAISIPEIAEYAGTSPATLFRKFKAELGMTPWDYLTSRRLDEALSLLRSENYSVSDVALITGYADLPSFSKAFKAKFGRAPSLFLKSSQLFKN
jgi:AraC-like DNA-binding protein